MIAINVLICAVLLLLPPTQASTFDTGKFQFLRRRTGSQVKRVDQAENVASSVSTLVEETKLSEVEPAPAHNRRFISFGLRKRTKSDDATVMTPAPAPASGFTFSGLLNGVVNGLVVFADSIDELEHQFNREQEQAQQAQDNNYFMTQSHIMRREEAASILQDKEKFKKYAEAFEHDSEKDEEEEERSEYDSSPGASASASESEKSEKSKGSIHGNDDLSSEEDLDYISAGNQMAVEALEKDDRDVISVSDNEDDDDEEEAVAVDELALITTEKVFNQNDVSASPPESPKDTIPHFTLEPIDQIRSDYVTLSDSDSESWEKVERNMIDNVQVLVRKPVAADLLRKFADQKTIIQFLASVFIKLARQIFFKPAPVHKLLPHSHSFEDFVYDFSENETGVKADCKPHRFLDFETAHRVLFYNIASYDHDDWCLLLPDHEDFSDALDFLPSADLFQIDIDINRLPQRYYDYYAETMGRERLESDTAELQEKVRLILAFILAFESKEFSSSSSAAAATTTTTVTSADSAMTKASSVSHDRQIFYTQGFDQVAAYFAINFNLDQAGPIAHRFFQLFMAELINFDPDELATIRRRIDSRAVSLIRAYLKDQMGSTVLDFEALLGILEFYPFSNSSATILYFTSATTWTDLDRLIQFLILQVPQDQAYKCVSLLAAANMLYSMLALDRLFDQELGSHEWSVLKDLINRSEGVKRFEILDSLVLRFMGDLFLVSRDKIIHADKEFDEFLLIAQSLIPYLKEFN